MAMQLLKLVAGQVKAGQPLPFHIRDEHGKLLLAQGKLVHSDSQLAQLLERGLYADLAEVQAWRAARAATEAEPQPGRTLFDLWEQTLWRLDRLLKSADPQAEQPANFPARCDEFARQLMQMVRRDPDIAIYLSMRQDVKRLHVYGLTHGLHAALVGQLMGQRMGWDDDTVCRLVKAALTMNLSIIDLQGRLATGALLGETQRQQIRQHPEQGTARLRAAGVDDEAWLRTVLEHHECPGGGGYPHGHAEVGELAQALRLADVFMAKISPRTDRPALPVQAAAKQMYQASGGSPLAAALIKEYGLYPPGEFVQLASGELAVVIRRSDSARAPLVAAITNRSGVPVLSTIRRDTSLPSWAIVGPVADKTLALRVVPERLYGLVG